MDYSGISIGLAEGARFELAVHEVDAGFQVPWYGFLPASRRHRSAKSQGFIARCVPVPFVSFWWFGHSYGHSVGFSLFFRRGHLDLAPPQKFFTPEVNE